MTALLYGAQWAGLFRVDVTVLAILNFLLSSVSTAYWQDKFTVEQGVFYRIRSILTVPACIYVVPFTFGTFGVLVSSSHREELTQSMPFPYMIIPAWALCVYLVHWLRKRRPKSVQTKPDSSTLNSD